MHDEIPMHDSVHWPVEDDKEEKTSLKYRRYLVTVVLETFVVVEIETITESQAIAQVFTQLQSSKGATVEQQGLLTIKASSAIALS